MAPALVVFAHKIHVDYLSMREREGEKGRRSQAGGEEDREGQNGTKKERGEVGQKEKERHLDR